MTTIAIEICVNPDSNLEKATDNAAWLAAKLLKAQGLDHQSLYQHHDWSGKNVQARFVPTALQLGEIRQQGKRVSTAE